MTQSRLCLASLLLIVLVAAQACDNGATVLDGPDGAPRDAPSGAVDSGSGRSWCGRPDDLPCCPTWPSGPPDGSVATVIPVLEPPLVVAVDDATRTYVETGADAVVAIWRGVVDSGDPERPSRISLEVAGTGTLQFDIARPVADFPAPADGTTVQLSVAVVQYSTQTMALRLARADGTLIAALAGCADGPGGLRGPDLHTFLAPLSGGRGASVCREPEPVYVAGNWCYIGRTAHTLVLDGVGTPVERTATLRINVAGAQYDVTNHRYATQDDLGGPHVGGSCAPAIGAQCVFSAFAVE